MGTKIKKEFDSQVGPAMDQSGAEAGGKFTGGLGGKLKSLIGPAMIAAGALAAKQFITGAIAAGETASTSNARIDQIATSMGLFGENTGVVTDRLVKLAEAQARATGVDQNAIKETQAKLLTFKEIAETADDVGGNFDRATKAAIDLAAAGFGSAEGNAASLGKALNDPIKGITALTRSGVTFTAAEQEKIKTLVESGNVLEAQNMVLAAIETQVGGTAEATANASDKMAIGFSQLEEKIGLALLPVFETVVAFVLDEFLPGIELIGVFLKDNFPIIATFAGVIAALTIALNGARIATAVYAIAQGVLNAVMAINPIALVVIAVAALAAGIVWLATKTTFFQDTWKAMTEFVSKAWEGFAALFETIVKNIQSFFTTLVTNLRDSWKTTTAFFEDLIKKATDFIVEVWDNMISGVQEGLQTARDFFESIWNGITDFFKSVVNGYISIFESFFNFVIEGANGLIRMLNRIQLNIPATPFSSAFSIGVNLPLLDKLSIPRLAEGVYVDSATLALIGEAGPEVVTPLKDFERMLDLDKKDQKVIHYYAAPNQTLDSEQALFQAMRRAKVVANW